MGKVLLRVSRKCRRVMAARFGRRLVIVNPPAAIISFTFDDAPKSAFSTGARILRAHCARATYFMALGLLGSETEVGKIASLADLSRALEDGNELGCHTYDHLDAWETSCAMFMESVTRNRQALEQFLPGGEFKTFAYPKSGARLEVKRALAKTFIGCRGGGQSANVGSVDLNLIKACFIDRRTNVDQAFVRELIDRTTVSRGWLVFATHDVDDNPSPYGCSPAFFDSVVKYAARSGAMLLPMGAACGVLMGTYPARPNPGWDIVKTSGEAETRH